MKLEWVERPRIVRVTNDSNKLGAVEAGVSVGGGLLGLAVLVLAGYGIYKLAKKR
jgi:hypothetical protein